MGWAGYVASLGGAYLLDGRLADATLIAQEGLTAARQRGERRVEGQVLRLLGDIAAHPDRLEVETAEAHYHQALALAEALGLRPLLAHCHLGLGALFRRAGTRQEAREHLTTAATMFGEMDMGFWREQADAELKRLPREPLSSVPARELTGNAKSCLACGQRLGNWGVLSSALENPPAMAFCGGGGTSAAPMHSFREAAELLRPLVAVLIGD